jgi:hypothetical protein
LKWEKNSPSRVKGVVRTQWRITMTVRVTSAEEAADAKAAAHSSERERRMLDNGWRHRLVSLVCGRR